jgi:myo-inositol 2-dehydrogenase/D-chiro-inositol 1-dehydrogenase
MDGGSAMTVRVGIIGTGAMGADHARTLGAAISGATVGAVFDVARDRAVAAVSGIDGARVLDDPIALIKDPDVDAVLIASSDTTHEEFVHACLGARKPVLCEKPLAPDEAACLRIVDAELALGWRLVSVGFMRRHDSGYAELRHALRAGDIGTALMLHCVHRNVDMPRIFTSEMVVTSSAAHEIDIARWLLGDEFVRVTSHRSRRSGFAGAVQDPQFLVLEMSSGVLVDVEVFVNARYGYDVRCELVGERGTVSITPAAPTVARLDGRQSEAVARDWRDRFASAYRRELQDWVDGIEHGEARGASAWDGYVATVVAQACVAALGAGVPVDVELATKPVLYK